MEFNLTLHGMHCDSCAKVIERTVARHPNASVKSLDVEHNRVVLECGQEQLSGIRSELLDKGYQLLLPGEFAKDGYEAGSSRRGIAFFSNVLKGAPGFASERRLVGFSFIALLAIMLVQGLLYVVFFQDQPKFISNYWHIALLTAVSVVTLLFAFYHTEAFSKRATCMTGMMIGMTFGMAGGFLIGAFAGATNGMFVGSLVGMAVGMGFGYYTGRCCGVMGVMEGLMGGLMAGTMGAMLSVMLILDHLIPFLYVLTVVELVIMAAFSYMLYKEYGNLNGSLAKIELADFVLLALAFDLVLTAIFVLGPKSGVVL